MGSEEAYRSIEKRLRGIRNRIVLVDGALLLFRLVAATTVFFLLSALAGSLSSSLAILRVTSVVTLFLLLGYAGRAVVIFVRRWPTLDWIAAELERSTPDLEGDLLRGALDLWRRRGETRFGYSPSLVGAVVDEALRRSAAIRERSVLGLDKLKRAAPAAVLAVAASAVLFSAAPDRATDALRVLGPRAESRLLEERGLDVRPGDCRVEAGESVPVEARFAAYDGDPPELLVRSRGTEPKSLPMAAEERGGARVYEARTPALEEDAEYLVRFDGGESRWFAASVHRPPVVASIGYTLRFPAYAGLEDEVVAENHGNVTALAGTDVFLRVEANKPVRGGRIEVEGMDPIPLRGGASSLAGSFAVDRRFVYRVVIEDEEGGVNADPIAYRVTPIDDEEPFVRIVRPEADVELGQEMKIDVGFTALDDYGVTSVNLVYRKGEDEQEARVALFETDRNVTELEREREWDLSSLNLFPQDIVVYYLEAWDNDAVRGPKRGVSETRRVRMPSVADIFASASEDRETEIADLEEIYEEGKELEEKIEELAREIRRSEDISWDEKEKIEGVLEKQKEIEEALREVTAEMEKTADKLEENQLVTPETMERMMELARLMEEVATDEMRRAMQELQAAMRDLKPEEIRQAAEKMELTQQDFLERLDRAIEMLKRLKDLQDADALAAALQRMAERQRELRERTEAAEPEALAEMAREEEALQEELERLTREMEESAKRTGENSPQLSEAIEKTLSGMEEKKPSASMQKSSEAMKEKRRGEATRQQQQAENDLFDLAFRLSEQIASLCNSSQQSAQAAFGESILDLLYLSEGQEDVAAKAERAKRSTPIETRRALAEREQEISAALGRVMEKIREVGREVPELSSFVIDLLRRGRQKADEASANLESGEFDLARTRSDEAMREINRAVVELLRSQESHSSSCNNPSSEGQGLQQLQRMTERQRSLNMESGQIPLPSANPGSLPMEARAQMARLAAEQQEVRKGVEQLQREVEGGGTGETLGKLDRAIEEMRELERALEKADIRPETREKQERVLSRMLEAQRSIRERGYRKERRSRPGEETETASPRAIAPTLTEIRERMREDPVRAPTFAIPPEYEELIRSYFESLAEEK